MKTSCFSVALLLVLLCESAQAEKLTLADVAINPGQGILLLAKAPGPEHYLNVSFLDELRKNGLVDKLYK
jgi:hypothetical protein